MGTSAYPGFCLRQPWMDRLPPCTPLQPQDASSLGGKEEIEQKVGTGDKNYRKDRVIEEKLIAWNFLPQNGKNNKK